MKNAFASILALAAFGSLNCWGEQSAAQLCVLDLQAIPGFLLENDTGAKIHFAQLGQKHFDDAFAEAKSAAEQVTDASNCDEVLRRYLKAWRKGHLSIRNSPQAPVTRVTSNSSVPAATTPAADEPSITMLSKKTLLLTLKSFRPGNRVSLIALLKRHHEELAAHPNWIIDVRGNGGGSDSSYEPLLPWLLPDETVTAGAEWLATPANILGQEQVCARFAPGDPQCEKDSKEAVARMRSVKPGTYIAQEGSGEIQFERVKALERRRPSRVAILIDGGCASTCEEFVLAARQSFSVKLIGRCTFGSLDYSNLRPYALPSGQRELWYATSRSLRLPDDPVDIAGIPPDIYLPQSGEDKASEKEMRWVQSWLEGGSLAPAKT